MVPNFSTAKQSFYMPFASPVSPFPQRKSNNILLSWVPSSSAVPLSLPRWPCFLPHRNVKSLGMNSLSSQIHTHLLFSSDFGEEVPVLSCFSLIPAAVLRALFLTMFLVKAVGVLPLSGTSLFSPHVSLYQHIHTCKSLFHHTTSTTHPMWHLEGNALSSSFPFHLRCSRESSLLSIPLYLLNTFSLIATWFSPPPLYAHANCSQSDP